MGCGKQKRLQEESWLETEELVHGSKQEDQYHPESEEHVER